MNYEKIGSIIKLFRTEKNMTQKNIANQLNITEQAVSKWERGIGLPDISSLSRLADILGINVDVILNGDLEENNTVGANMKNLMYYICPICGNTIVCVVATHICCCSRDLVAIEPQKAEQSQRMSVEKMEDDWYITTDHPMTKEDYISFTAFATGERIEIIKHYPEWNLQVRIPKFYHGKFIWYSKMGGLQYQLI